MSGFNQAILLGQLTAESESYGRTSTPSNDLSWKNGNVLFVHSALDEEGIPYHAMRLLAHLRRRQGRNGHACVGIDSMARVCRMKPHTIIRSLKWLELNGYLKRIPGKGGKASRYKLLIGPGHLYVDHRLDDFGLSPIQLRVLMHMAKRSKEKENGVFYMNESGFAIICGADERTVHSALEVLERSSFYAPYPDADRRSPMCYLTLNELFPRESNDKTVKGQCAKGTMEARKRDNEACKRDNERLSKGKIIQKKDYQASDVPIAEHPTPQFFPQDEEAGAQEPLATSSTEFQRSDFPWGDEDVEEVFATTSIGVQPETHREVGEPMSPDPANPEPRKPRLRDMVREALEQSGIWVPERISSG